MSLLKKLILSNFLLLIKILKKKLKDGWGHKLCKFKKLDLPCPFNEEINWINSKIKEKSTRLNIMNTVIYSMFAINFFWRSTLGKDLHTTDSYNLNERAIIYIYRKIFVSFLQFLFIWKFRKVYLKNMTHKFKTFKRVIMEV